MSHACFLRARAVINQEVASGMRVCEIKSDASSVMQIVMLISERKMLSSLDLLKIRGRKVMTEVSVAAITAIETSLAPIREDSLLS